MAGPPPVPRPEPSLLGEPTAHGLGFGGGCFQHPNIGIWPIEHGDRATPVFNVAIDVGDLGPKQPVGLRPDLVRRRVIDPQRPGASADVDSKCLPGERC
jgi:hypothetical protein